MDAAKGDTQPLGKTAESCIEMMGLDVKMFMNTVVLNGSTVCRKAGTADRAAGLTEQAHNACSEPGVWGRHYPQRADWRLDFRRKCSHQSLLAESLRTR
jgi:transcriptional regulator of nitric oxide reductase